MDFKINESFNEKGITREGSNYSLNKTKHLYKLKFYNKKYTSTPNKDKVILLDTLPKIIKFNKKYMTVLVKRPWVDWDKVSIDYAGIEFRNYREIILSLYKKPFNVMGSLLWYSSIDIDSGCIWRPSSVIKDFQKILTK